MQIPNSQEKIQYFHPPVLEFKNAKMKVLPELKRPISTEEAVVQIVRSFGASLSTLAD